MVVVPFAEYGAPLTTDAMKPSCMAFASNSDEYPPTMTRSGGGESARWMLALSAAACGGDWILQMAI